MCTNGIPKGVYPYFAIDTTSGDRERDLGVLRVLAEYQKSARVYKSNLIVCVEDNIFKIEAYLFSSNKGLFLLWRILFLVFHLM
ncbi:hypothetical protein Tco_1093346 [Tanacetum coccineum]|uniref:Uncharacterized protein n=1 Tax=Tanacetum coccineum TaxID=301880 RepID=A0ABQ5ICI8_9ASTR